MKFEQQIESLKGAYSAIFTPFDREGAVNFEMLSRIVDFQLAQGLKGFFVTGTTGEGLLLSFEERVSVIRHVVECCGDRAIVIAHVGHPSSDYASQLARESARAGVDWIASVGPIYYGLSFEGTVRHYRQIAGTTDLPFMIYSFGDEIDWHRDIKLFEIPNVCGMKYTGANFFSVQQLARRIDRPIALISGFDEQFVAALSFGFQGGIGSTYNFAPAFYSGIYQRYCDGDIRTAATLQSEINQVTDLMIEYENWSYRKAIMRYIGFDCGAYRPPYCPISETEFQLFSDRLDELGVLAKDTGRIER